VSINHSAIHLYSAESRYPSNDNSMLIGHCVTHPCTQPGVVRKPCLTCLPCGGFTQNYYLQLDTCWIRMDLPRFIAGCRSVWRHNHSATTQLSSHCMVARSVSLRSGTVSRTVLRCAGGVCALGLWFWSCINRLRMFVRLGSGAGWFWRMTSRVHGGGSTASCLFEIDVGVLVTPQVHNSPPSLPCFLLRPRFGLKIDLLHNSPLFNRTIPLLVEYEDLNSRHGMNGIANPRDKLQRNEDVPRRPRRLSRTVDLLQVVGGRCRERQSAGR
jgi:hypothetical protein